MLRRRWLIIAFVVLVALAASLGVSLLRTPVYAATTQLLLEPSVTGASGSAPTVIDSDEVATQAQVVTSLAVATRVLDNLGLPDTPRDLIDTVDVSVDGTRVLGITAVRENATEAAAVANGFAEAYLAYSRDEVESQAQNTRAALDEQLSVLTQTLSNTEKQLRSATGQKADLLNAERQSLLLQHAQVAADLASFNAAAPELTAGVNLLPAVAPSGSSAPALLRTEILVAIVALILGVGLALLRDRFDDGIHDEVTLLESVPDHLLLGQVPLPPRASAGGVTSLEAPRSAESEAYRAIGTNLRFLMAAVPSEADQGRVLLISSAAAAEGKTATAANLAVAAARMGMRVVLVDADLRKPQIARTFGVVESHGLSNILVSDESATEHLIEVGVDGLLMLPAGTPPPNPAELTGSVRMRTVLADLAAGADLVILDSAPILPVADTMALLPMVDLVVLVCRAGLSQGRSLRAAVARVEQVGIRVAGLVLNDVSSGTKSPDYSL